MSPLPRLVAFDLDDTLAPSKTAMDPRMAALLTSLLEVVPVCIISGGHIEQFRKQVIGELGLSSPLALSNLHLMPTCGTQYFRFSDGEWLPVYEESLTDDERSRALRAVEGCARDLGLWEENTWGAILEDRGSQITFSALGQTAPVTAKKAWDPTGAKKNLLRSAVADAVPDLEVRSGGSTSVDITRKGIDKAYGMTQLAEITGIAATQMLFIGDRLDPDGNDFPVKSLGVPCHAVECWEDTAQLVEDLLVAFR